jgi:predicted kinase
MPGPGGPTGEAAEADAPKKQAQPQAAAETAKQPKGAVVLSIGLPGSGKSTWFKRHNILPLSSDMVRILLFDDATEQRHQDLVFSTLRTMLRARLLARRPSNYLDATNLSPHERRSWIKLAHDFGYEAHAVFFDVPPEVCMERNRRRERNVPEDVMQRMASKLRPPKFEEGFAKITVVRLKKKDGEAPHEEPPQELPIEPEEGKPPAVVDSEY